jgi:rubredoxin
MSDISLAYLRCPFCGVKPTASIDSNTKRTGQTVVDRLDNVIGRTLGDVEFTASWQCPNCDAQTFLESVQHDR